MPNKSAEDVSDELKTCFSLLVITFLISTMLMVAGHIGQDAKCAAMAILSEMFPGGIGMLILPIQAMALCIMWLAMLCKWFSDYNHFVFRIVVKPVFSYSISTITVMLGVVLGIAVVEKPMITDTVMVCIYILFLIALSVLLYVLAYKENVNFDKMSGVKRTWIVLAALATDIFLFVLAFKGYKPLSFLPHMCLSPTS